MTLTARQQIVVGLLVRGRTYKAVAEELGISVKTVGAHASHAYRRLGVENVREAVRAVSKRPMAARGALPARLFAEEG